MRDVDHLKQRLIEKWRCFDQNIIDQAVRQWRVRLRMYVRANGGHFEHKLLFCVGTAKATFPYRKLLFLTSIFSERELMFTFAICRRASVCLSVCRLSVCNVRAPYSAD